MPARNLKRAFAKICSEKWAGWVTMGVLFFQIGCAQQAIDDPRPKVPHVPGDPSKVGPLTTLTRKECIKIADSYVNHHWKATVANIHHGPDASGLRVDTPDGSYQVAGKAPGFWTTATENVSIPYCWGGMDTPESFDRGIAAGKYAGDVCTDEKRRLLDAGVSKQTCGVDCSGLVSRCWKLDWPCSTREIPFICEPLASFDDLKPGDVVNFENAHVMLVSGFMDGKHEKIMTYQTGTPRSWRVTKGWVTIDWLKRAGYKPWRYKGIRE